MGKKIMVGLMSLVLTLSALGCLTTNWAHNRRHFLRIRAELHELHMEIDRVIFGLPEDPAESKLE
jgi:hypothetical protein